VKVLQGSYNTNNATIISLIIEKIHLQSQRESWSYWK